MFLKGHGKNKELVRLYAVLLGIII